MSVEEYIKRMFPVDADDLRQAILLLQGEPHGPLTSRQAIAIRRALMSYEAALQNREVPSTVSEYVIKHREANQFLFQAGTAPGPQWWTRGRYRAVGLGDCYSFVTLEDARTAFDGLCREHPWLAQDAKLVGVIHAVDERYVDVG